MRRQLITGLRVTVVLVVLLGLAYPAAVWAVGQVAFKHRANGSFVTTGGKAVGSALIGQSFSDNDGNPLPQYFQPRPSAAGKGYDATSSGASNLGPLNPKLLDSVAQRAVAYRQLNGLSADAPVPIDAVTASGSGLDPDISIANAADQAPRIAKARSVPVDQVLALVRAHTNGRQWGFLGEKTVNVLNLNLALDRLRTGG
jgi:K+-transporting ATPase ATPase C chain